MKPLQPYHHAWLGNHSHRSEAWLRERLADGFDIHHIDANHFNNEPSNLVLIEHADHMRLHGMTGAGRLERVRPQRRDKKHKFSGQEMAVNDFVNHRRSHGASWVNICRELNISRPQLFKILGYK